MRGGSSHISSSGRFLSGLTLLRSAVVATLVGAVVVASGTVAAASSGRQALTTSVLRVCADPDNLPFSNEALEGFENRIVEAIAEHLELEVRYTWYPQTTGFVRNTLRLRACDVISGITTTSELVQNTNPYYHSVYTMVYRKDSGLDLKSIDRAALHGLKLGVVAGTPPADVLAKAGLMAQIKPYQLVTDTRRDKPARAAIEDIDKGVTDVAFIWGPIAAWHAQRAEHALAVVPLLKEDPRVRMDFRVSMAVRYNETDWKHTVNQALEAVSPKIDRILEDFDVPLLDELGQPLNE